MNHLGRPLQNHTRRPQWSLSPYQHGGQNSPQGVEFYSP